MSAISDYLEPLMLNEVFNKVNFVGPATYAALFITDPTDAASGTEASGVNYARILVNESGGGAPEWNLAVVDAAGFLVDNQEAIDFAVAGAGGWGTIAFVGIFDALAAGNLLWHGALTAPIVINENSQFSFPIGDLNARLE